MSHNTVWTVCPATKFAMSNVFHYLNQTYLCGLLKYLHSQAMLSKTLKELLSHSFICHDLSIVAACHTSERETTMTQQTQNDNNQNKLEENKMAPSTTEDPYILWNKLRATTQNHTPRYIHLCALNFLSFVNVFRDMLPFTDVQLHHQAEIWSAFENFTTHSTSAWLQLEPTEMHVSSARKQHC